MGCGASKSSQIVGDFEFVKINEVWQQAERTVERFQSTLARTNKTKRTGWKTIRIFVSSTFKDFHQEREILVKKVFILVNIFSLSLYFFFYFSTVSELSKKSVTTQYCIMILFYILNNNKK